MPLIPEGVRAAISNVVTSAVNPSKACRRSGVKERLRG